MIGSFPLRLLVGSTDLQGQALPSKRLPSDIVEGACRQSQETKVLTHRVQSTLVPAQEQMRAKPAMQAPMPYAQARA